jgi:hypothetical protein
MTPHPLTVLAASLAALAATWALTARADEAPVMVSSEIVMQRHDGGPVLATITLVNGLTLGPGPAGTIAQPWQIEVAEGATGTIEIREWSGM